MKYPKHNTLWHMAVTLLILTIADIVMTTIGIVFFDGREGNPLIVRLAALLPGTSPDIQVVHIVWLLKITVMGALLLAVRAAVKSKPVRDDMIMFAGLSCALTVYFFVIGSWIWYFLIRGWM